MRTLPTIASFWYGSDLSWMEVLCIKSFLDQGHRFVLYASHDIQGVPEGVERRDASEIFWPPPFDITDKDRLRVAVFSDIFRVKMIMETGYVWVDLDAYCVRAFDFQTPYIFAFDPDGSAPNGVIGLPKESPTLRDWFEFLTSENPGPPWLGRRGRIARKERIRKGERWGIETLRWGVAGPKAFAYFLKATGEDQHAMAYKALYSLHTDKLGLLHETGYDVSEIEGEGVYSVHFYGHQKKLISDLFGGMPLSGSYLEMLCARHEIDPKALKIESLEWMKRKKPIMVTVRHKSQEKPKEKP